MLTDFVQIWYTGTLAHGHQIGHVKSFKCQILNVSTVLICHLSQITMESHNCSLYSPVTTVYYVAENQLVLKSACLSVRPSVRPSVREHAPVHRHWPISLKFGTQVHWVMGHNPTDFERNRLTPGAKVRGGHNFSKHKI